PCFPISQVSDQLSQSVRTRITAFNEDYQQPAAPKRCAQPRRIPEWLIATGLAIGK
ncbi:uncharacterized protein TRAVEDRAFT_137429, partial [Trametes versicolor FP-101664 SS1]